MPEYMKKRYGGHRLRVFYAIVQLVLTILTGISVSFTIFTSAQITTINYGKTRFTTFLHFTFYDFVLAVGLS